MFRKLFAGIVAFGVLGLAACGGGGSGGSSSGGASIPTINVSLSASSGSAEMNEGATATTFTVKATSSGSASTAVVPDLQYDTSVFSSVTATPGTVAGTYDVVIETLPDLGGGAYTGNITFRLCQEVACTHVYPGSTVKYAYDLKVRLEEWTTYQRNNRHTGYVHATLDVSKFVKAWEWNPTQVSAISPVVEQAGHVYFTTQEPSLTTIVRPSQLISLNELNGAVDWTHDLNGPTTVGPPSISNGVLYVGTVSSAQVGAVSAIVATTGALSQSFAFDTQWTQASYPIISGDSIFFYGGQFGTVLYGYSWQTGGVRWTHDTLNTINGTTTVATDNDYVYYYNGVALKVVSVADGSLVKSILDPYAAWAGYDYDSGVMLGGKDNAIAYSGTTSFSSQYLNDEHYNPRPLVNYSLMANTDTWKGAKNYYTNPAVSKNVVYVARNDTASLDALSETDGSVLWSWTPPAGETFHRNTVVTDNLVFVSTDKAVYAISLSDHTMKWSYPMPGTLTLSSGFMLYISADLNTGEAVGLNSFSPSHSRGKLVAIKLQ